MQLVIDTNVIIAALLKSSMTRRLLFEEKYQFFAPEYIRVEIERLIAKDSKFRRRLHLTKEDLDKLVGLLFEHITIFPEQAYCAYIKKARSLVTHFHDTPFIALALALKCSLWSNDTELKDQSLITVYSTKDLLGII